MKKGVKMNNEVNDGDLGLLLTEIKQLEFNAKAQIHDLHVIMNYLIKQLDIFDRLNEKYPNILTFKTAITESQEIVEKIIVIQEQNQKCLQSIKNIHNLVDDQNEVCKNLRNKLQILKVITQHIHAVFDTPQVEDEDSQLSQFKDVMKSLDEQL